MADQALCIIPQPKQVAWGEGAFQLTPETAILLLPQAPASARVAAQALQQEIADATGLHLPIYKLARPDRTSGYILLVDDWEQARAFTQEPLPFAGELDGRGEQAYCVDVDARRVIAGGDGALALHYAAQTCRQLARGEHTRWPSVRLVDWPSLPYRGVMMDVSRGKVPTVDTIKLVIDELALYKANVLQFYTEHTFAFAHHPRIGQGCGSLTNEDILELDAYARERQIELIPNLQSFGHCAHILNMPEYAHLAESEARWSLCPTDERTYAFLDDLYADMLPAFGSPVLNIGCDETYDLGKGRSTDAAAQKGTGRLYLEHILRLRELAQRYGRRIQLWGDILLHYPDLVPQVPDDVTLLDWHYEAQDDYPSVQLFAESGRDFWVCPGTSSWNTLFPRIENSNRNISTLARLGVEHGAKGLLNTDWGDNGHYQPIGQCWYGYIYGAEQAWTGGATPDETFDACFGRLFFGAGGEAIVQAMRALGRLNTLPGMPRGNGSHSVFALLDEPLVGTLTDQIPRATLEEIVQVCARVEQTLRAALAATRDRLSVEEMIYSTRMMDYMARKVMASQDIAADVQELAQGGDDAAAVLTRDVARLDALDSELVELDEVFREQWLRRARNSEIRIALGHLAGLRARYAAARAWLVARLAEVQAGQSPDYDLSAYRHSAESYEILGQSFLRRMREAGVL
ncbi:MAG: family 20 glycosylhydrolase [Chloroflexi bacterium]|nr:family 20 glycosylhydrolase [Chloroflexota bacterium]